MRVKYVLNEVLVGLWRNVTMTVAMIITMSVSLTMLGASVLMYLQVDRMKNFYYGEIEVSIFLADNVSDGQIQALQAKLSGDPLVKKAELETKAQALERFKVLYADSPDFVAAVNEDSLPQSFRVKLKNPEDYNKFTQALGDQASQGIQRVIDQRELLQKVFNIFNSVQLMSLVVAAVMAFAALLLVGNTIQVAAYSKRREVAVMKLVGASNWFIQAPFVLEAVVAGLIGSILGFVALFIGKIVLLDNKLQALTAILTPVPAGNVWLMLPLLAGVGAVVSAGTAWVTLRFYLKV
ncbi:cell division protein FtsY [Actinoplanes sp. SE50]|uniref:permease-like cell division protein FtsX n=1 Tax=unclassified Actinoplanes TaxID=2626549 RepID=UPI00023EC72D|nr:MULTISPECIES: permease-like cell division protein FtsX [unclassified Actinoplanes]AEV81977.1 Macrolide export ATP-binding/permease protein macB [Actinoplanes sp. SE50/110]ATO80377.1 cell division protein FtsY [Actinoplanes sp. SE50]SLL97783.1 cell division protein FtsY [Actinoplanes sp. SE50/110]